jgi:hypothetical protein
MVMLGTSVRASSAIDRPDDLLGLRAEHFDARRVLSVVMRRLDKTDRRLAELRRSGPV